MSLIENYLERIGDDVKRDLIEGGDGGDNTEDEDKQHNGEHEPHVTPEEGAWA